jgi:thymidylate synthase ThyX
VKVTLIDYTGNGNPDPHYAARLLVYTKNTRLTQGEATRAKVAAMDEHELHNELSYVADTIRSSWEFISYTWEVTGVTRAYTHQQVRSRHGKYAQQAQRVVDMTDFETLVPATVMMKDKGEQWQQCAP